MAHKKQEEQKKEPAPAEQKLIQKPITPEQMRAWVLFVHTPEIIRRVEVQFKKATGLTLNDFSVLHALKTAKRPSEPNEKGRWDKPGPTMNELVAQVAAVALLDRTALSRLVDRLVKQGLVIKNTTGHIGDEKIEGCDGRHAYIYITREGARTYKTASTTYQETVGRYFAGHIDDEDAKALTNALGRLGISK